MNEGRKLLEDTLKKLDKKTSKKARKQSSNIRRYLKEEGPEIKEPVKGPSKKQKVKHHLTLKYEDVKGLKAERYIDEDGNINLDKKPLMVIIIFKDITKTPANNLLTEASNLQKQCLVYDFEYKVKRHQVMLSCENCYYAYTTNNKFCELMVKAVWIVGLGYSVKVYNKEWDD
jgi:hypothetical protein